MPSASIRPPALVWSQSSWSIAGAHYKHWATSLGNFGVTPFFGGNFTNNKAEGKFVAFGVQFLHSWMALLSLWNNFKSFIIYIFTWDFSRNSFSLSLCLFPTLLPLYCYSLYVHTHTHALSEFSVTNFHVTVSHWNSTIVQTYPIS